MTSLSLQGELWSWEFQWTESWIAPVAPSCQTEKPVLLVLLVTQHVSLKIKARCRLSFGLYSPSPPLYFPNKRSTKSSGVAGLILNSKRSTAGRVQTKRGRKRKDKKKERHFLASAGIEVIRENYSCRPKRAEKKWLPFFIFLLT